MASPHPLPRLRHAATATLCALFALLTVNRLGPELANADTLMQSLMSLQHLTLFYWGQARFPNLFPLIAAPVTAPHANLWLLMWLYAFGFYLLLALLAELLSELPGQERAGGALLPFALLIALVLLTWREFPLFVFAVEGQIWAWSFLCLLAAFRIWLAPPSAWRRPLWVGLLFLAIGLNPSTVAGAAALAAGAGLVRRGWAPRRFLLVALLFFALWMKIAALLGEFYAGVGGRGPLAALAASSEQIASALRPAGLWALATALALAALGALPLRGRPPRALVVGAGLLFAFAAAWWLLFSQHRWVQANLGHFRYFFPVLLVPALTGAALLPLALRERLPSAARAGLAALLLAGSAGYLARPPVAPAQFEVLKAARPAQAYAAQHGIQFVGGDYWRAWPVVHALLAAGRPAFGLAYRGDGNRAALEQALEQALREATAQGGPVRAICLAQGPELCGTTLRTYSGRDWRPTGEGCPGECLLFELPQAELAGH